MNMNQRELLQSWNFPHQIHGGVTLVSREYAKKCLRTVIEKKCRLHGYEGFTHHDDGRLQPHMEWSASWQWNHLPPMDVILQDVLETPELVTHFELVFTDAV
jgi:hypothetical protein